MKKGALILCLLCCSFLLTAQKSMYTWKDRDGVLHISDTKPEGVKGVQEAVFQQSPAVPETPPPPESGTGDILRQLDEEKAKRDEQSRESVKQGQAEQTKKEYERLRAEEERARGLYDKAQNPFARNYSIQRLREIEKEKERLREMEERGR